VIRPATRFRIARVPLAQIVITTVEPRYQKRMSEYAKRLTDAPDEDVLIALGIAGVTTAGLPLYYVQDGRHRFLASLLAGRPDVLGLIHYEPGDHGYDEAQPVCAPVREASAV
jgi:hypothetical protein